MTVRNSWKVTVRQLKPDCWRGELPSETLYRTESENTQSVPEIWWCGFWRSIDSKQQIVRSSLIHSVKKSPDVKHINTS